jgi:hypothetical protein
LLVPLFNGGTFDSTYDPKYVPYNFTVPAWATKVLLYAVITAHGSDNNNCGEFCVSTHFFYVTGAGAHNNSVTFSEAGTPYGCTTSVPFGGEPNEHGTWFYGRGGWCDGQNVAPWVTDITPQLLPAGAPGNNSIWYQGYFNGTAPDPTQSPGYIIMWSYLSFWG